VSGAAWLATARTACCAMKRCGMNRLAWPRPPKRLGAAFDQDALAYVFKTVHLQHGGKLSLTRVLSGHLDDRRDGCSFIGRDRRVAGISAVNCSR